MSANLKQLVFGRDPEEQKPDLTFTLKREVRLPLEAEALSCDNFVDKSLDEIAGLTVFLGKRKKCLGEFFDISGKPGSSVLVKGDLTSFKRVGRNMTQGFMRIVGDVGPHLGAYMTGGVIMVQGSVGDYAGAHMKKGRMWITGDAGNFLGAAYPGETKGVNKGRIVVLGNAGSDAAVRMRRGLIAVMGDLGDFAGQAMLAGTIFCGGKLGDRAGAANKRGSIIALGGKPEILPTYNYDCTFQPSYMGVFLKRLKSWGLNITPEMTAGFYERYSGDVNILNKGEILVLK